MNANGKVVLGFLIGTAIGTVTGLLLAPTTGLRARKNINKKAKKLVKQIQGLMGDKKRKVTRSTGHVSNGRTSVAAR